jgi:hypothetical protein
VTPTVCLTVDVEDWYDGMAHLGHPLPRRTDDRSGLGHLLEMLSSFPAARVTLFVVADYLPRVRTELAQLVAAGHEVASHGPDHGFLPGDRVQLLDWLRRGRETLEDGLQVPVAGMRSPRFDVPATVGLAGYRELLASAGFTYVSDRDRLGPTSPVDELPVLAAGRLPVGGGSYQRIVPRALIRQRTEGSGSPAVHYYHSYDFGVPLPSVRATRSAAVAKQVLGRKRVSPVFHHLLSHYGSERCAHARDAL